MYLYYTFPHSCTGASVHQGILDMECNKASSNNIPTTDDCRNSPSLSDDDGNSTVIDANGLVDVFELERQACQTETVINKTITKLR